MSRLAYWGLWLFVFTIPWENMVAIPGIAAISKLIGLGAGLVGFLGLPFEKSFRAPNRSHIPFIVFTLWVVASLGWTIDPAATRSRVLTHVQLLAEFWLIWQYAGTRERQRSFLRAFLLGSLVSSTDAIARFLTGSMWKYADRYTAMGANPNELGILLAWAFPISLYLLSLRPGALNTLLYLLYIPATAFALLLTGSRAALLSLLGSLTCLPVLFLQGSLRTKFLLVGLAVAVVGVTGAYLPEHISARYENLDEQVMQGNYTKRTEIWDKGIHLEQFRKAPWTGVGARGFERAMARGAGWKIFSHSVYVGTLVELGILGAAFLAAMLLTLFVLVLKLPARERFIWLAVLLSWGIGAGSGDLLQSKSTWFLFAMMVAQSYTLRQGAARPARPVAYQGGVPRASVNWPTRRGS